MGRYFNDITAQEDFLEHHGILGMHWGKKNGPPYPLQGFRKALAEKRAKRRKKAIIKKAQATKAANKQAKQQAELDKKTLEERKKEYAKNPYAVKEHKNLYTTQELKDIVDRYATEKKLDEYTPSKMAKAKKKIDKAMKVVGGVTTAYNLAANLRNPFVEEERQWPTINLKGSYSKKKDNSKKDNK